MIGFGRGPEEFLQVLQFAQQLIEGDDGLMRKAVDTWTQQPQAA